MDVEAPAARRIQNRLRQDQAVRGDHGNIRAERREGLPVRRVLEVHRKAHGQPQPLRRLLHRRGLRLLAALRGTRRLRVDGGDIVPRCHKRLERRHREGRGSHEDNPHPRSASPRAGHLQDARARR
jgi:hypothetical protein